MLFDYVPGAPVGEFCYVVPVSIVPNVIHSRPEAVGSVSNAPALVAFKWDALEAGPKAGHFTEGKHLGGLIGFTRARYLRDGK